MHRIFVMAGLRPGHPRLCRQDVDARHKAGHDGLKLLANGTKNTKKQFESEIRPMLLKNKVCVVTGAASGIGAAVARAYAEKGARGVVSPTSSRRATGWQRS